MTFSKEVKVPCLVHLEYQLKLRCQQLCEERGRSFSSLVRHALKVYLESQGKSEEIVVRRTPPI